MFTDHRVLETNDKHIEVIIRQMMRKVKIINPGDTDFLPGSLVNKYEVMEVNEKIIAENETC